MQGFSNRNANGLLTYAGMLWATIKTRKRTICCKCSQQIKKGEPAYRPLTNNKQRMNRICDRCGQYLFNIL